MNAKLDYYLENPKDDIEVKALEILKMKFELKKLNKLTVEMEEDMYLQIECEYEENKADKTLSNLEKRKIVANRRLTLDDNYVEWASRAFDLTELIAVEEVRLSAMRRLFVMEYYQSPPVV